MVSLFGTFFGTFGTLGTLGTLGNFWEPSEAWNEVKLQVNHTVTDIRICRSLSSQLKIINFIAQRLEAI